VALEAVVSGIVALDTVALDAAAVLAMEDSDTVDSDTADLAIMGSASVDSDIMALVTTALAVADPGATTGLDTMGSATTALETVALGITGKPPRQDGLQQFVEREQ
jgi:hypothetical protein